MRNSGSAFVETHKSVLPKVPGVSRRNFRDRQFPLSPEDAQSASVPSDRSFSLSRTASRTASASVRYAYGRRYPFLSLALPSAACGRANFRPQAAWGSGAFAPASSKNVHFCDACTFLSLAENPFLSEPPDNVGLLTKYHRSGCCAFGEAE